MPGIYAVRVAVLDPQGRPIVGATVRASAGNEPQLLPDGWWEVEIPAAKVPTNGWVSLWAEHENWDSNRANMHLGEDPNPRVEIRLKQPEALLRGRVLDGLQRPAPGTRVLPSDGTAGLAITDAEGRFELKLSVPRGARVRLRAERTGLSPEETYCYAGRDDCSITLGG